MTLLFGFPHYKPAICHLNKAALILLLWSSAINNGLDMYPSGYVMVCPSDHLVATCRTSDANQIMWRYSSRVKNASLVSPDLARVADIVSYKGETVAFVTNTNISALSVDSEIHLNLHGYLLPVQVTCSTNHVSLTSNFILGDCKTKGLVIHPSKDMKVCPKTLDHIVVTCMTSDSSRVIWMYKSSVLNITKASPDLALVADVISYLGETVAFVTSTKITDVSMDSEIHLNLHTYLLPIEVTCLTTNSESLTRRFTAGVCVKQKLVIHPPKDVTVCVKRNDHAIVRCQASGVSHMTWKYTTGVINATLVSPDLERIADVISYRQEIVAFVTSTNITETDVDSEIHLNLHNYLLPIEVTCSTHSMSRTRRFLAGDCVFIDLVMVPTGDTMICPNHVNFAIVTCYSTETNQILWTYVSKVINATTVLSPDISLVADTIAYRGETVAFVTNTNITETSIYSEIHLNLYDYLLPIMVTCATNTMSRTKRFLPIEHPAKLEGIKVGWFRSYQTYYTANVVWSIDTPTTYLTNKSLTVVTKLVPDRTPQGTTPKSDNDSYMGYFLYDEAYKLTVQVNVCGKKTSTSSVNIQDPLNLRLSNNKPFYMKGTSMNVTCRSDDPFPNLETEWLNNSSVVSSGSVLNFTASPSLSGSYRCQFQNISSNKFVNFILIVHYKPMVTLHENNISNVGGMRLKIVCTIDSSPLPFSINWTYEDKEINKKSFPSKLISMATVNVSSTVTRSTLEWRHISSDNISCYARNKFGQDAAHGYWPYDKTIIRHVQTRVVPLVVLVLVLLLFGIISAVSTSSLIYILNKKKKKKLLSKNQASESKANLSDVASGPSSMQSAPSTSPMSSVGANGSSESKDTSKASRSKIKSGPTSKSHLKSALVSRIGVDVPPKSRETRGKIQSAPASQSNIKSVSSSPTDTSSTSRSGGASKEPRNKIQSAPASQRRLKSAALDSTGDEDMMKTTAPSNWSNFDELDKFGHFTPRQKRKTEMKQSSRSASFKSRSGSLPSHNGQETSQSGWSTGEKSPQVAGSDMRKQRQRGSMKKEILTSKEPSVDPIPLQAGKAMSDAQVNTQGRTTPECTCKPGQIAEQPVYYNLVHSYPGTTGEREIAGARMKKDRSAPLKLSE